MMRCLRSRGWYTRIHTSGRARLERQWLPILLRRASLLGTLQSSMRVSPLSRFIRIEPVLRSRARLLAAETAAVRPSATNHPGWHPNRACGKGAATPIGRSVKYLQHTLRHTSISNVNPVGVRTIKHVVGHCESANTVHELSRGNRVYFDGLSATTNRRPFFWSKLNLSKWHVMRGINTCLQH